MHGARKEARCPDSSDRKIKKPDSRLPRWTWAVTVVGGILSYVVVGQLLEGQRFWANLERLGESCSRPTNP